MTSTAGAPGRPPADTTGSSLSAPTKKDIKPSVAWYWIGALVLVLGLGGGFTLVIVGIVSVANAPGEYQRISVPGERTLQLPKAGTYELYGEASSSSYYGSRIDPPRLVIKDASGTQIPVAKRTISSSYSYSYQGYRGYEFGTITVGSPGAYSFSVSESVVTDDPLPPITSTTTRSPTTTTRRPTTTSYSSIPVVVDRVAVGEDVGGRTVGLILGGIGVMGVGTIVGIVMMIVVAVRRSSSRKRLFPPTARPAYGSGGGYGPPGYGPPGYGPPGYGPPGYGAPGYGAPGYGPPGYGPPGGARPGPYGPYGAPPPGAPAAGPGPWGAAPGPQAGPPSGPPSGPPVGPPGPPPPGAAGVPFAAGGAGAYGSTAAPFASAPGAAPPPFAPLGGPGPSGAASSPFPAPGTPGASGSTARPFPTPGDPSASGGSARPFPIPGDPGFTAPPYTAPGGSDVFIPAPPFDATRPDARSTYPPPPGPRPGSGAGAMPLADEPRAPSSDGPPPAPAGRAGEGSPAPFATREDEVSRAGRTAGGSADAASSPSPTGLRHRDPSASPNDPREGPAPQSQLETLGLFVPPGQPSPSAPSRPLLGAGPSSLATPGAGRATPAEGSIAEGTGAPSGDATRPDAPPAPPARRPSGLQDGDDQPAGDQP